MARSDLNVSLGLITKDFEKSLKRTERKLKMFGRDLENVGKNLTQAVSVPLAGLGVAAVKSAADFEKLEKALIAVTGDADQAAAQIDRLRQIAESPGLGFEQAVRGSARLQAVGLSASGAERALAAFGNAVARSGGGADDLDGAILALTQIASKGKISAEEINQLNERVFEIRPALDNAFGTSNSEELQKLGISAEDFIAGVTSELEKLEQVEGGLANAIENVQIAIRSSLATFGEAINKTFDLQTVIENFGKTLELAAQRFVSLDAEQQKSIIRFAAIAAAIGPVILLASKLVSTLAGLLGMLRALSLFIVQSTLKPIASLALGFKDLIKTAGGLGKALLQVGKRFLIVSAQVIGIVAIIATVAGVFLFVKKNAEAFGVAFERIWIDINNKLSAVINRIIGNFEPLFKLLGIEVSNLNRSFQELPKAVRFQSFNDFLGSIQDDALKATAGIRGLKQGYESLVGLFKGGETDQPLSLELDTSSNFFSEPKPGLLANQSGINSISESRSLLTPVETIASGVSVFGGALQVDSLTPVIDKFSEIQEVTTTIGDTLENKVGAVIATLTDEGLTGLSGAFDVLFSSVLDGSQNAFRAFSEAIKDTIKQLIVLIARTAAIAGLLSIFTGGAGFGSIFKGLLSGQNALGLTPFADGGIVTGPTPALVGEAGPEAIIPLSQMDKLLGSQQVEVIGRLRGEDIFFANRQAGSRLDRNRG